MPEFGVVAETLAGEAAGLSPLGGELASASQGLDGTRDAAEQTAAADACAAFVRRASTMLSDCAPALDQVAAALELAAVCYERADQAAMGG